MLPSIRPLLHLHILLSLLFSHPAQSSIGVVEIDDLLQPDLQKPLKSPNHPDPSTQYAPWTHEPLCTVSTSFKSLGTKFCLYTNDRAFINGVSILTTPAAAEAAAEYLNEEPLSYFLSEAQQEEWFNGGEEGGNGRPWKIVPVEGKDLGVVATRRIRRHETFMVDQASVVMDLRMEKLVPRRESLRLLKKGVERLRRPGWVRELSGRHEGVDGGKDGEEEGDGEWEEHVMMTNAFGTQLGETEFRGLFPLVSRINHACDPNSFVMFSNSGFSLGIRAYRDIQPGEEITISYLLLGKPHAARQEGLKRWGFNCTCALCTAPPAIRAAHDTRRNRIAELEPQLNTLYREGKHNAAIAAGEEIVELMLEEGLTSLLPEVYVMLTRLYLVTEQRERAEEAADLALEILEDLGFLGMEGREGWGLERLLGVFVDRGVY